MEKNLHQRSKKFGSIDSSCQFHQHCTYEFFVRTSFRQLIQVTFLALSELSYEHFAHLTLMKLTPVQYLNVFEHVVRHISPRLLKLGLVKRNFRHKMIQFFIPKF